MEKFHNVEEDEEEIETEQESPSGDKDKAGKKLGIRNALRKLGNRLKSPTKKLTEGQDYKKGKFSNNYETLQFSKSAESDDLNISAFSPPPDDIDTPDIDVANTNNEQLEKLEKSKENKKPSSKFKSVSVKLSPSKDKPTSLQTDKNNVKMSPKEKLKREKDSLLNKEPAEPKFQYIGLTNNSFNDEIVDDSGVDVLKELRQQDEAPSLAQISPVHQVATPEQNTPQKSPLLSKKSPSLLKKSPKLLKRSPITPKKSPKPSRIDVAPPEVAESPNGNGNFVPSHSRTFSNVSETNSVPGDETNQLIKSPTSPPSVSKPAENKSKLKSITRLSQSLFSEFRNKGKQQLKEDTSGDIETLQDLMSKSDCTNETVTQSDDWANFADETDKITSSQDNGTINSSQNEWAFSDLQETDSKKTQSILNTDWGFSSAHGAMQIENKLFRDEDSFGAGLLTETGDQNVSFGDGFHNAGNLAENMPDNNGDFVDQGAWDNVDWGDCKPTNSKLVDEFDPKHFLEQVPVNDSTGAPILPWKRQILARQLAEKALQEHEAKVKQEEEESKFKNMPSWKRAILEKKESDKGKEEETRLISSPKGGLSTLAEDEDGGSMAPWQQELRSRKTP